MTIDHATAVELEHLVCEVCECKKHSIGGVVSSANFESYPIEAAILCIAKLTQKSKEDDIRLDKVNRFVDKWRTIFGYPKENPNYTCEEYLSELTQLISLLK